MISLTQYLALHSGLILEITTPAGSLKGLMFSVNAEDESYSLTYTVVTLNSSMFQTKLSAVSATGEQDTLIVIGHYASLQLSALVGWS